MSQHLLPGPERVAAAWNRDSVTPQQRIGIQHDHGVHTDCDRLTCPHWSQS